jgi:cell division protein FtsB
MHSHTKSKFRSRGRRQRRTTSANKEPDPDGDVTTPVTTEEKPAPAAGNGGGSPGNGSTLSIPSAKMAEIKKREREKGARLAVAEFAKTLGFESPDKLGEALKARAQQPQKGASGDTDKQIAKLNARITELETQNKALAGEKATWERTARRHKQSLKDKDVEMEIRAAALKQGVTDPDFAVELVRRHAGKLDPAAQKDFDVEKFFGDMKETRPHLFAVTEVPATTGPGGKKDREAGGAPPPAPKKQEQQQVDDAMPDARKMKPDEYNAQLAKHGLKNPALTI